MRVISTHQKEVLKAPSCLKQNLNSVFRVQILHQNLEILALDESIIDNKFLRSIDYSWGCNSAKVLLKSFETFDTLFEAFNVLSLRFFKHEVIVIELLQVENDIVLSANAIWRGFRSDFINVSHSFSHLWFWNFIEDLLFQRDDLKLTIVYSDFWVKDCSLSW